jgi:hypothetical protein
MPVEALGSRIRELKLESLYDNVDNLKQLRDQQERLSARYLSGNVNVDALQPPPNGVDISSIECYPSAADLLGNRDPTIVPNVVNSPWSSGPAYLATNFKLLREDFITVRSYREQF